MCCYTHRGGAGLIGEPEIGMCVGVGGNVFRSNVPTRTKTTDSFDRVGTFFTQTANIN